MRRLGRGVEFPPLHKFLDRCVIGCTNDKRCRCHRLAIRIMRCERPNDPTIPKAERFLLDGKLECKEQTQAECLVVHAVCRQPAREERSESFAEASEPPFLRRGLWR